MAMARSIAGMVLPDEWEIRVNIPRWTAYCDGERADFEVVEKVFGEAPDRSWRFYTFDEMAGMTEDWRQETDHSWFGIEPESIDSKSSVLIGELGYDRPFALDFRQQIPCVRFMRISGHWPVVATTLGNLIDRLETPILLYERG